jgi:hypothetical protein
MFALLGVLRALGDRVHSPTIDVTFSKLQIDRRWYVVVVQQLTVSLSGCRVK